MDSPSRRYLVFTELFLPTKGGTAVWFAASYRRLGGKGIHIVTADVPGADEVDATHPNSIHRLSLKRSPWLRPESLVMYLHLLGRGLMLAFTKPFESVHAGRVLPEGLVAWLVSRIRRIPLLVYVHGEELTSWGRGKKYQAMVFVLRRSDRLIANSDYTRGQLLAMGVREERITLIHPGVDIERFKPGLDCRDLRDSVLPSGNAKLLLSVGRLQRRKGFDKLIQAVRQLVDRGMDVHYALIGIGEDREYLGELAVEQGVEGRVHFLGHVSEEDLPRWYNACDLFAMPNRELDGDTEGFGMVYVEAGACGKPVIAGLAGGTGSAVMDGITGLRVDGNDESAVSAALARLLEDEQLRRDMGQRGHRRAVDELSWDNVAQATLALCDEMKRQSV